MKLCPRNSNMNRSIGFVLLVAIIAIATITVSGQAPDKPKQGFLSALKTDQQVIVKEITGRYEITVMEGMPGPMTHKVIELNDEYIVVEDLAMLETRIPIYSVKSIVTIRLPKP
jgi:hypothetical protein